MTRPAHETAVVLSARLGIGFGRVPGAVPDWNVGDTIPLGGGTLRVVAVEWSDDEDDEVAGTLTVEIVQYG